MKRHAYNLSKQLAEQTMSHKVTISGWSPTMTNLNEEPAGLLTAARKLLPEEGGLTNGKTLKQRLVGYTDSSTTMLLTGG